MAFNELVRSYYSSWFRFHPEQAVAVGESGYEELLRPYSDDDIGALTTLNESLLSALLEIDSASLTEDEKTDFNILYSAASNELHELLERDWRYSNPEAFLPVNAIHQLLTRPVKNIQAAVRSRLQAIPSYLRGAKTYLKQKPELIPQVWLQSAISQAQAGASFLLELDQHPVIAKFFDKPERLHEDCEAASNALKDFQHFLEMELQPVAKGDFAVGRKTFDRLLKEVHFLELNADQLYHFGEDLFTKTKQQLDQLLDGKALHDVLSDIKTEIPKKHQLLDYYRQSIQASVSFIKSHDLITIPDQQRLSVVETPGFLKHEIPFAAYDEPARNDKQQLGHYYVSVPENEAGLAEHNKISIDLTSVHEAYPGHHLQFSTANLTAGANSLVRVLNATSTFYEGWALYCEELMVEQGYLNKPEHKIVMLRDRLWRALRIMIDVDIHTRGVSIEEAAQRLSDELGFEIEQSRAELNWYSFAPTVPMSYATGWAIIRALRDVLEQTPEFELKAFHDALLASGSVALPLVMRSQFGEAAFRLATENLFTD